MAEAGRPARWRLILYNGVRSTYVHIQTLSPLLLYTSSLSCCRKRRTTQGDICKLALPSRPRTQCLVLSV